MAAPAMAGWGSRRGRHTIVRENKAASSKLKTVGAGRRHCAGAITNIIFLIYSAIYRSSSSVCSVPNKSVTRQWPRYVAFLVYSAIFALLSLPTPLPGAFARLLYQAPFPCPLPANYVGGGCLQPLPIGPGCRAVYPAGRFGRRGYGKGTGCFAERPPGPPAPNGPRASGRQATAYPMHPGPGRGDERTN